MVRKRGSDEYHYIFQQSGKRYWGVCEGCTTKAEALAYEKRIRDKAKEVAAQKSVSALVENYKRELTGGDVVTLAEAFDLYMDKPRRVSPSPQHQQTLRSQWNDFVAFMADTYPDITQLDRVTQAHAEAYIHQLREKGRYVRIISFKRKNEDEASSHSYNAMTQLSSRTVNAFHKTLKSVFAKLQKDAGIIYNPFDFEKMTHDSESRDAFTPAELKLIGENLTPFVRPLFVIGMFTGLSEGDICTLRWDDIRDGQWIVRRRRKTGAELEIPILPPLADFFEGQKEISGEQEYILPEHAAMYAKNSCGISYRVKTFLEGLGIKTTKMGRGRGRATSIKGLHSLRHTFAYMAGCYQIPLPIVQSILGHMSPEMTKHYQAHATREAKVKYLSRLPDFIGRHEIKAIANAATEELRQQILDRIEAMPHNQLEKLGAFLDTI